MSKRKCDAQLSINCTAGAVSVKNEKGHTSMQNVKVQRYISGKRPDYAPRKLSEDESDDEEFIVPVRLNNQEDTAYGHNQHEYQFSEVEKSDPRLRRLQRKLKFLPHERDEHVEERPGRGHGSDSESEDDILDDGEIEKRRTRLRQRALEKMDEEEILAKEEEKYAESEESESSDYEEYTDSEEEAIPRLKPVFVRKCDRETAKGKDVTEEMELYDENGRAIEERRKETLKLLEKEILNERERKIMDGEDSTMNVPKLSDVLTDDEENGELAFELWKLREMKRVKRDREEREAIEREKIEIEHMHTLTEEERQHEMKLKPKVVTNRAPKGEYKFLQKFYHRGAFYLDKEDDVLKRNNSEPTLEDHFDKSVLPQVMQVKNFGRSGRTKYTHLTDQDTTDMESPWASKADPNMKFHSTQTAAVRQVFEKPSSKKSRKLV